MTDEDDKKSAELQGKIRALLRKHCGDDLSDDVLQDHVLWFDYWYNIRPSEGAKAPDRTGAKKAVAKLNEAAEKLLIAFQAVPEYASLVDGRLDLLDEIKECGPDLIRLKQRLQYAVALTTQRLNKPEKAKNPNDDMRVVVADRALRAWEGLTGKRATRITREGKHAGPYYAYLSDIQKLFGFRQTLEGATKAIKRRAVIKIMETNRSKPEEKSPLDQRPDMPLESPKRQDG